MYNIHSFVYIVDLCVGIYFKKLKFGNLSNGLRSRALISLCDWFEAGFPSWECIFRLLLSVTPSTWKQVDADHPCAMYSDRTMFDTNPKPFAILTFRPQRIRSHFFPLGEKPQNGTLAEGGRFLESFIRKSKLCDTQSKSLCTQPLWQKSFQWLSSICLGYPNM